MADVSREESPRVPIPHPAPHHPVIELGELLRQYQLGLVLVAGIREQGAPAPSDERQGHEEDDDATATARVLARPVQWVHVSELGDPTPFLTPRTVLLTTGARFAAIRDGAAADAYVSRLVEAGVTALGVAIGLHWDRIPAPIVSACDRFGLPLFRVPYATAFITIVQTAARLLEAGARERDQWALESQRAVANASLHRDGLAAAVREAAARLDRWVCVTDRSGRVIEFAPQTAHGRVQAEWIRRETRRLIDRGVSAGRIGSDTGGMQLQTLGRHGQVLGVLVVEDHGAPDNAERTLIGLVAALATVQLEHRAGIDAAQVSLREAIVQLLLAGSTDLAEKLAHSAVVRFPRGSVTVARHAPFEQLDPTLVEELHSLDAATPGLFCASHDGSPLIIAETRHMPALRRAFLAHRTAAGFSERGDLGELGELIDQAERAFAYARSSDAEAPLDYLPALHEGVLRLLDARPEARKRAESMLAPIRRHDRKHDDVIETSLTAWLRHHGQTSAAATELGVHRHTLTGRVRAAAELLQVDLDSPDVRADLWAALRLVGSAGADSAA
ncbi:PucR family transcriptional regulator [Leucobacter ruminantium]|uniref:PucR family transcriptional regulator n=1 Tax=Leucobacter ruminantium TaxID=1289170 RepID=A0A939M3H5_9MICO|nr:PucR family transcriptional regulator [Leucobacter ruminantium]MBO1806295.1 PucR family transcriptional regulator [Leucobacter ruminantium]